ncbi:MAG: insulinase family protein [Bryobacteraceae bacterium]|nr:insulinase family protein [Bryobacteraceae bacterium]
MSNRIACLVLLFCLVAQSLTAQALPPGVEKAASVEGITEYRLQNGLRVLLFPDPTKTSITVNITYLVGSRHEDYGETGMAHLLEHLLFKGSSNHPNIPKELQDHGTRPNGSTWFDRTNYFETFAASDENLEWALSLEADRMVNSFIARKDLDSEMTVVRNEYEAGENSPQSVLMERVISTMFLWHNYGKSTIGARSDIERVPIERLQAFYRHFYQPDNALLVVAGKIDEAKTLALVAKHFGPIPKPSRQLRKTYTSEPVQDGERSLVLRRVGDIQAIAAGYHIPPGTHPEYAAIDLASDILSEVPAGRLHKALVETKKATRANSFTFQLKEPGVLLVMAQVRQEGDLEDARKTLLATIDEIKTRPFTQEELDRVKTAWQKNFDLTFNDSQRIALGLSEWHAMGDWRMLFLYRDRVKDVKLAEVQKAAEKYLIESNRTVGVFIPDKTPLRAEIPDPPDVDALVKDYKGQQAVSQGEAFDASPANIDKRTARGSIANGPKIAFISKKTRGEQVVASLSLHFGDEKSLENKSRIGQMTGQMLMRGTSKRSREQIKQEFDRLKAQVTISGGASGAFARVTNTRANLPAVLDLVAEILKEPSFPQSEFEQLKQQALASAENMKSEPQAIAMINGQRHVMSRYKKGDPRYVPTIEEQIEEIKTVSLEDLKSFHKQFYGASKAELAVIGDFDAEAVQRQANALFGGWKSPAGFSPVVAEYAGVEPVNKSFETPDKANATFFAAIPFKLKDTDPDYPALVLGNYILGSGLNSRLFARIRGKEGLSYGVGSNVQVPSEGDMALFIAFAIANPANVAKVEASFKDELGQILEKGYTDAEIEAAKKSWLQARQVSRANDNELVGRITTNEYLGRTMAFEAGIEEKVKSLTAEQIRQAMRKHISLSAMNYFKAGDFAKAAAPAAAPSK